MSVRLFTLITLFTLSISPSFAVEGGPELDRNIVSMLGEGDGELWGQIDYVNDAFNIFGYGTGTSGLNYSLSGTVGGKYALTDRTNLRAQYSEYEDEAWRSTEPKLTKSSYSGVETVLQDIFYVGKQFDLAWNAGYRKHSARDGDIRKFQFGGYLVEAGESTMTVSGLAQISNSALSFTLSGADHTVKPVDPTHILIDDNYTIASMVGNDFDVSFSGKTSTITADPAFSDLLTISSGGTSVQISPGIDASGSSTDIISIPRNATNEPIFTDPTYGLGTAQTAFLRSVDLGGGFTGIEIIASDTTDNILDASDSSSGFLVGDLPGSQFHTDDIAALIDIDNSFGILNTPNVAAKISDLNQLLDSIDTNYLVNAEPEDESWSIGLTGAWYPDRDYRVTVGADYRRVHIKPNYLINPDILQLLDLYNDLGIDNRGQDALSAIERQLPQEDGWDENHLLISAGADWSHYEDLTLAAQYTYYNITRDGYQSEKGKVVPGIQDQTTNHQLDGWLYIKPNKQLTLYLHGRAYSNFLLGDRPLLYNARVNHKFDDPYGVISAGVVWEF